MRQLNDAWVIRHEFTRRSRWQMLAAAFHRPSCYYLADIYFCLIIALLIILAGQLQQNVLIMLVALGPVHFCRKAITPALRNAHPIADNEIGLEYKYRRDFQYFRFKLFSQSLLAKGITRNRVKELSGMIQLESELGHAHPPAAGRSVFAIQLTLFIGLLAALGSIDRFWIKGYVPTMLAILPMTMYVTYYLLAAFPPRLYQEKELALFLQWYCLSDIEQQPVRVSDVPILEGS